MRAIVAGLVTVCLALLGYIGAVKVAPSILTGLAERADHALEGRFAGVQPVEVDDARRAILTGHVESAGDKDEAARVVAELSGIAGVDNQIIVGAGGAVPDPHGIPTNPVSDPRLKAVTFLLTWDGGHVSASGKLPSDVATAIPRALATQFPSAVLTTDILPLAGAAPPELGPVLDSAARALSVARRGKVELRDGKFTLDAVYGRPETESSARALVTERVGVVLRTTLVTRVEADTGPVGAPDVAAGADVSVEVAEAPGIADAADATPTEASDAQPAEVTDVEVLADAAPEVEAGAMNDGGPVAPVDAGVTDPGGTLTPAQCKGLIAQLIEGDKRITFKGAKELTPDADAKVQQIAALLARCPDAKTTVSGYHDDYGEPDHINAITGMRANAVFKRLIELGIDKARLKWRGRGYANMRYSTRTQGSRVLNQRIEFDIVLGAP